MLQKVKEVSSPIFFFKKRTQIPLESKRGRVGVVEIIQVARTVIRTRKQTQPPWHHSREKQSRPVTNNTSSKHSPK